MRPPDAPDVGDVVEELMAAMWGLEREDATHHDARTSTGERVQIKGCARRHANGGDELVPGRWTVWREELLNLLEDGGIYLLAVYDEESDLLDDYADGELGEPSRYVVACRWVTPEELGAVIDAEAWHDAHRPSKGERARLPWLDVLGDLRARLEGEEAARA